MTEFDRNAANGKEALEAKKGEAAAFTKDLYLLAVTVIASVVGEKLTSELARHLFRLFPFITESPIPRAYSADGFLYILKSDGIPVVTRNFYYALVWFVNDAVIYTVPLLIFGCAFRGRLNFKKRGIPYEFKPYWVFLFFAAGYAFVYVSNIISNILAEVLRPVFGGDGLRNVFESVMPKNDTQTLIMFASVGIIAPVCEELIYRRFLLNHLRRYGDLQAVIITALLFGFFHGNLTQFLYATMGGLVLGFVAVKANSVVPAMVVHSLNNTFDLAVRRLPVGTEIQTALFYGVIAAGVVSTAVMAYRGKLKIENANPYISGGDRARIIAQNPLILIMVVVLAAVTIADS
ncbi:MAG: CPBP family intramembrane metalloprotease [Oscillospiraceae bacterium]|nr:CPBP family intramembrane metalloprotease [Oscillospiraceae bacterium]